MKNLLHTFYTLEKSPCKLLNNNSYKEVTKSNYEDFKVLILLAILAT